MSDKKKKVKQIFDDIAHRYDFLNHFLSFGFDFYWRRKAIQITRINRDGILLDVACGTGDFAIEAKKQGVKHIIGTDLSNEMLKLFEKKSKWIDGNIIQSLAENLPFKDESINNITIAFGVRNFFDIRMGFNSFHRVLKNNGKATILEFKMPSNKIFRGMYKFYFKRILPLIGGLISKNRAAYNYLPESVEEFDEKVKMKDLLLNAGFKEVESVSLTLGIVQVLVATK